MVVLTFGWTKESKTVQLHWACTAPRNNKKMFGHQKYTGVGGHLFAIAVDMSCKWGYDGYVYGYALNKELLKHYIDSLMCMIPILIRFLHLAGDLSLEEKAQFIED